MTASKIGVSTKTRVRDGSVLMHQRWLQWVNELLVTHQTWHRSGTKFQTSAKNTSSFLQYRKMPHAHSPGGRLPPAPKQVGNTRAVEELLITRLHVHQLASVRLDRKYSRVRWIWLRDKSVKSLGFCVAMCSTQSLVPCMT